MDWLYEDRMLCCSINIITHLAYICFESFSVDKSSVWFFWSFTEPESPFSRTYCKNVTADDIFEFVCFKTVFVTFFVYCQAVRHCNDLPCYTAR